MQHSGKISAASLAVWVPQYGNRRRERKIKRGAFILLGELLQAPVNSIYPKCSGKMRLCGSYPTCLRHLNFGGKLSNNCFEKAWYYCPACSHSQVQKIALKAENHNITRELEQYARDLLAFALTYKAVAEDCWDGVEAVVCDMNSDFQAFEGRCSHIPLGFDYFHIVKDFNNKVVTAVRMDAQKRKLEAHFESVPAHVTYRISKRKMLEIENKSKPSATRATAIPSMITSSSNSSTQAEKPMTAT